MVVLIALILTLHAHAHAGELAGAVDGVLRDVALLLQRGPRAAGRRRRVRAHPHPHPHHSHSLFSMHAIFPSSEVSLHY